MTGSYQSEFRTAVDEVKDIFEVGVIFRKTDVCEAVHGSALDRLHRNQHRKHHSR